MYTNFDFWDEKQYMDEKIENFFGDFSSSIRQKLLAKNLAKPQSLYDVYYPAVKQEQMKKNEKLFNTDLDEFSEGIRQQQLSKVAEKVFSLEEHSEDFRNSLLAREKLHKDKIDLDEIPAEVLLYVSYFDKKRRAKEEDEKFRVLFEGLQKLIRF